MTTEHEMAIEIAKEIGKQVPVKQVYDDTTSPAAKQVGATIEDVIKCVRLVGFPIQWLAVQQDRFRAFIERAKDQVPPDRRVLPPPQILGPVLEGIRYEVHDSTVVDMFEALLSAAMDKDRVSLAHPSYPSIIRQLSSDEAVLLARLYDGPVGGEVIMIAGADALFVADPDSIPSNIDASNIDFYVDHLTALGLIYTEISNNYSHRRMFEGGFADRAVVSIQPLGKRFVRTCRPSS